MLLSDIHFAALLAYSPHGVDAKSRESQTWAYRLKDEGVVGASRRSASEFFVDRLAFHVGNGLLADHFGADVIVVPMPGHALWNPDGLWVPDRLCTRLVDLGLAARKAHWLERVAPVEKSRAGVRVSAEQHADSMKAVVDVQDPARVLIVDDVITRGSVGLAAISLVKKLLPGSDIRLFAMIRTISDPREFRQFLDPCVGTVALQRDGTTVRHP